MDNPDFSREATYLHTCLFHRLPDVLTIARYDAAHRELFPDDAPTPTIARIVERHLDAEAIEFALRRRGRGRELTRKLQVLSYLVEARSRYLDQFVNFKITSAE
jgi:hypothetical protein